MAKEEKEIIEIPEDKLQGEALEKAAEAESLATEKTSLEDKKKALLEKAAKLKSKVEGNLDLEAMKEEVKDSKKKADMLIDLEEYVKTGIYLGTRIVTPEMRKYVYRRRADGLAIFNTDLIDEMIKEGEEILELITKTIVKLQEKKPEERTRQEEKELTRWIVLRTNLAGIQNSNEFSFRQAEDSAKVTYGMTKNMSTLQPIIQQTLQTQTEIIAQNLRNQAMVDGINVGKELINTLQIQNQRESGTLMRETVKIATDPLIEEETLKKLQIGFEENQKKLKLVMQEQSKMIISYNKQVEKNQKVLLEHNQDAELKLPELNYEGKDS